MFQWLSVFRGFNGFHGLNGFNDFIDLDIILMGVKALMDVFDLC